MASLRLNPALSFYATKAEVANWIADWVERFELHAVFVKRFLAAPCRDIAWDRPAAVRKLVSAFDRLLLSFTPLRVGANGSKVDLLERNPECLYIDLPKQSKEGMKPGHLGSIANISAHLKVYRQIGSELHKRTSTGLWLFNPKTGKKSISTILRYSPEVEQAAREGLTLLPEGGRSVVTLAEPANLDKAPNRPAHVAKENRPMPTKKEITTLFQSIRNGELATVRSMIDANKELVHVSRSAPPKKDDGQSPLQVAFKTGEFEIADYLMDQGANVNYIEESKINEWRAPVLHDALRAAAFNAGKERFKDALALLKKMLKRKADPNAVDSYGNNCLHRCILDARQCLPHDKTKASPAMIADFGKIFSTLIKAGADVHAANPQRPESAFEESRGTLLERYIK